MDDAGAVADEVAEADGDTVPPAELDGEVCGLPAFEQPAMSAVAERSADDGDTYGSALRLDKIMLHVLMLILVFVLTSIKVERYSSSKMRD